MESVIDTAVRAPIRRPGPARILPDPFYYLSNFEKVVASLDAHYEALWTAQERQFIGDFRALAREPRALLVRMVIRKGVLFRASRLNYPEIGETRRAVAPLLTLGWVEQESSLDVDSLAQIFTKAELLDHFSQQGIGRQLTKSELIGALRGQDPQPVSLQTWQRESADCVYGLRAAPLCEQLRLMFFGNFHQDWSDLVLADLGLFSYEKIPRSLQTAAFRTRAQIEALFQLHRCRQLLEAEEDLSSIGPQLPPPVEDCGWIEDLRQRLMFQIARAQERKRDWDSALLGYSACKHRGSRMRAIRLHERAGHCGLARDMCLAATEHPESAVERSEAQRVLLRLNRKLGIGGTPAAAKIDLPSFELAFGAAISAAGVEQYVRDQLILAGGGRTSVHFVENSLVISLFGLLCWQAIFAPIAGAFFHEFQQGPADLSNGNFYERRRRLFDESFAQLGTDQYQTTIRRCYADKKGIQSPFVSWASLSADLLDCALECFPAAHLRLWFEWIVDDLQDNRAGFPDLVQFWPMERRYRLIEVKGPGDRLQDNQRRLLEFCVSHRMPVSVCYLR